MTNRTNSLKTALLFACLLIISQASLLSSKAKKFKKSYLMNKNKVEDDDCIREFKKAVMATHNKFRALHGVEDLVLDDELSAKAQLYSEYLTTINRMVHSSESASDMGENIYLRGSLEKSPRTPETCKDFGEKAVNKWYSEKQYYNWDKPSFSFQAGHFSQVVWKNTNRLGCGIAIKTEEFKSYFFVYVVCNYLKPGNYEDMFSDNVLPLIG
mmetsp:Transcript_19228/g.19970  ORF Transcript_19228/g.19970 Transcript_19228/m.19970 type:complete len:212 (+) Transcript_19228:76-711(+)